MSLPNEVIERLAMDRALKELSDDAAALWDQYLAEHPADAVTTKSVVETLALARSALMPSAGDEAGSLPRLRIAPGPMDPNATRAHRPGRLRDGILGFAAAAAIALAFWFSGVWPMDGSVNHRAMPMAVVEPSTSHPAARAGFWSWSNLQSPRRSAGVTEYHGIKWIGPVTWPKMGAS